MDFQICAPLDLEQDWKVWIEWELSQESLDYEKNQARNILNSILASVNVTEDR